MAARSHHSTTAFGDRKFSTTPTTFWDSNRSTRSVKLRKILTFVIINKSDLTARLTMMRSSTRLRMRATTSRSKLSSMALVSSFWTRKLKTRRSTIAIAFCHQSTTASQFIVLKRSFSSLNNTKPGMLKFKLNVYILQVLLLREFTAIEWICSHTQGCCNWVEKCNLKLLIHSLLCFFSFSSQTFIINYQPHTTSVFYIFVYFFILNVVPVLLCRLSKIDNIVFNDVHLDDICKIPYF